ncbi:MAG: ABC transporter ATP-binding protein [Vicinamibacterales bacterium]
MAPHDHPGESMSAAAALSLRQLRKAYGPVVAVDGLSLDVPAGAMVGLLGPSGCGKTTVLRLIAGLVPATDGAILVDGEDVTGRPPHRRDIGLVFQHYALFPHLTVAANVAFGLEMRGVAAPEVRARVADALALVRLPDLGGRRPQELSGGQQQRVALARALVVRPRLLLLDEPLSNLDARLRDELRAEIRDIQQRLGITTVFVTHDQAEALAMCDLVGVMAHGRLAQVGTPRQVYEHPATRHVAEFVGRLNVIPCQVVGPGRVRLGDQDVDADTAGIGRGAAVATIRPPRLQLAPATSTPPEGTGRALGTIARVAFVGDVVQVDVAVGGELLRADSHVTSHGHEWRVGDAVSCWWTPADLRVFPD